MKFTLNKSFQIKYSADNVFVSQVKLIEKKKKKVKKFVLAHKVTLLWNLNYTVVKTMFIAWIFHLQRVKKIVSDNRRMAHQIFHLLL